MLESRDNVDFKERGGRMINERNQFSNLIGGDMERCPVLILIICVFLLFGFTSLSLAQGPAEEREDEEEAAEEMSDDVKGYVVAIDVPSRSIAVREDESGEIIIPVVVNIQSSEMNLI